MELSQLFPISTDLDIILPTGESTGIKLKVVGQDSKQFREVSKRIATSMLGKEEEKPDVEALERQGAELAAACIIGWSGLTEGGIEIPFTQQKAVELMLMPELTFIRQQVEVCVSKRASFFRKSEKPAN